MPADADDAILRTTVLAIDTSKSMKGERFAAAQAAAREFISAAPADVLLGIVTFDSDVETALPPTQDRAAALAVVDALELKKQTLLYDGVLSAVQVVGDDGQRNVLVLSDGADTSETPSRRSPPPSTSPTSASTWSASSRTGRRSPRYRP